MNLQLLQLNRKEKNYTNFLINYIKLKLGVKLYRKKTTPNFLNEKITPNF